ncbi:MAG: DNA polymerase III subunit beta [Candidatus Pacebacteria bacterium]|nr:DNA polymerase III subunit beta [Candidatus Paceibacterota bacterium]
MRAVCEKKYLQNALILSEKIAGKNNTLPILNAVLLATEKKSIIFSSTNLEIGLKISIPAKIEKEGVVAVSAKLFSSFVSSFNENEEMIIDTVNNNLVLSTKNSSTTIKGYNPSDFPILPKISEKKSFIVSAFDFVLGLRSVFYSSSLSETKPEINSVYIYSSSKTPLTFVATDSFRLAEKKIPYNLNDFSNFLIPYRNVIEILKIFENQEGDLTIKTDDNNLNISSKNIELTSRLTDGTFLDYKQIIPNNFINTAQVNKKRFIDAIKTSSLFSGKLNEVKIKIYKNESFLEIQTSNPDFGENTINIPAKTEGEDLVMVFNYKYLIDSIQSFKTEDLFFKFSGEGKPLLITGFGDNSFVYLVMPMKDI